MRARRKAALVLTVALAVLAVAVIVTPSNPVRRTWGNVRNAECFKRPGDSGGIVALGDSITSGVGDADVGFLAKDSWVSQAFCDDDPIEYAYNAGVPAETAAQIASRVDSVIARRPVWCVVLAGTNDVLQGLPLDQTIADIERIVDRLAKHDVRVAVGTIPPINGQEDGVDRLNGAIRALEGVVVIDFHGAVATADGWKPGFEKGDGVHPSEAGAVAMARAAEAALRQEAP